VIQSAYGDSGKTTYAIEACATQSGTYVGPLLGELIGFKELTPYQGGWCGNELYQDNFNDAIRAEIHEKTQRLGDTLYKHGYKGYFEIDYLIDLDDGSLYS